MKPKRNRQTKKLVRPLSQNCPQVTMPSRGCYEVKYSYNAIIKLTPHTHLHRDPTVWTKLSPAVKTLHYEISTLLLTFLETNWEGNSAARNAIRNKELAVL